MRDGSLIVPVEVQKIIPTPSRVSWISRDQKLHQVLGSCVFWARKFCAPTKNAPIKS